MENVELQYQGFLNTPFLWKKDSVFGLRQFYIDGIENPERLPLIETGLMLGKRVEKFVLNEIEESSNTSLILQNVQVFRDKKTLGEIDMIILHGNHWIHLEVSYKFYLYDEKVGNSEIDHWIAPNRLHSLKQKASKIRDAQFPLLFTNEAKLILNKYSVPLENLLQRVYFKGQLFVPLHKIKHNYTHINPKCIIGFYLSFLELDVLNKALFYIPRKIDWLIIPNENVKWISFGEFKSYLEPYMELERSQLCWMKSLDGTLNKFFVTYW